MVNEEKLYLDKFEDEDDFDDEEDLDEEDD